MSQLTWYFEVEITGAAHSGDGGSLTLPGDALLHPAFTKHLHCERTSCSEKNIMTVHFNFHLKWETHNTHVRNIKYNKIPNSHYKT